MEVTKISTNLYQYTFTNDKSDFSFNITAIIDDNRAVLIDLAYERFAIQVKNHLRNQGVSTFVVFISHHHEDHFDGFKCFPEVETYASGDFEEDFQEHLQTDDLLKSFKPSVAINDGDIFKFNNIEIECIYTPGHNKCEFSFLINQRYCYVGDLFFYNKNGLLSIPYIDCNSNSTEYISSIGKIKNLSFDTVLMGHGKCITDMNKMEEHINDYLFYLNKIAGSEKEITIEASLPKETKYYSGLDFHKNNLLSVKTTLNKSE